MRINEIIDKCGLRLLIFVAAYLLLRHFNLSTFEHILCAVTVTLAVVYIVEALLSGRKKRASRETVSRTMAALALRGDDAFLETLSRAANGRKSESGFITAKSCLVSARFCGAVTAEDIARLFREAVNAKCGKCAVYAPCGADAAARELIAESPIRFMLIASEKIYTTLQELDMLPRLADKKKKRTFREFLKVLLAKGNARKFLISAAVIFIFSVFVSFTVWYVVVAVVNIALAVVCLSGVAERKI